MKLDHLAIAAETLEEGVSWAEERMGVTFQGGGKHERFGTHNKLLGLEDDIYIEVIAADPSANSMGPRWFGLDVFSGPPRLVNWICEPCVLEPLLIHGMEAVEMSRDELRWDMGVPPDGTLPMGGGFPTVLSWKTDTPPGAKLISSGLKLEVLTVRHPNALDIAAELDGVLRDDRVRFAEDATISLSAQFCSENGLITL
ncbi:VOC family protein [Octadecabacter ascidiaceicola]|uniref:Glyoxalase-like domain-containing protein n=1 Tax=Octadecabacter ascidiaceicola TaxID=1655543 RepID=A0A238JRM3_9RHOB|nr:VOC family protein [Octadecabacter ascidiaceicola]SMX33093.1 hypothetical protein OCA8868_00882 [Octadecabacter ascidiaceicola]